MEIKKILLPGCYEMQAHLFCDERGTFVKTYQKRIFAEYHLETDFVEQYYSVSKHRVIRGLHFQIPPHEHTKVVYCVLGSVLDAVGDLRVGSPTYGHYATLELDADKANMIYIPAGIAHGFYVLSETAILVYNVTSAHSPRHDIGIRWDSMGIPWPDAEPIVSARDLALVSFANFQSPFRFKGDG